MGSLAALCFHSWDTKLKNETFRAQSSGLSHSCSCSHTAESSVSPLTTSPLTHII